MKVTDSITVDWHHDIENGVTVCGVTKNNSQVVGRAMVHRHKGDVFNRTEGRKRSLTRALKLSALSKEERTAVWNYMGERGVKLFSPKRKV